DQRAVRGASGDRERYRPVASRLRGPREEDLSDPVVLVRAYGEELEATTIYVADLDRLEGRGSHDALVPRLLDSAPGARFLWDAGLTGADSLPRALRPAVDAGRLAPILATEAPGLRLHAGGGIGSAADLDSLQRAGFAGALVAGALHDGSLTPHRLRQGGWLG